MRVKQISKQISNKNEDSKGELWNIMRTDIVLIIHEEDRNSAS